MLALVSGGIDSAVLLKLIRPSCAIFFDYGQKNLKEKFAARSLCKEAEVELIEIDIIDVGKRLRSALTMRNVEITDPASVAVPNRNAIFLNIAAGIAHSRGEHTIAYAAHARDQLNYPDCRPEFVAKMTSVLQASLDDPSFTIYAPFLYFRKSDLVSIGNSLGVSFSEAWSCYRGREKHCGECPACLERKLAFKIAELRDPTEYEV